MFVHNGVVFSLISLHLCFAGPSHLDPLSLCAAETRLRTLFVEAGGDITFTICVIISDGDLTLEKVSFFDGSWNCKILPNRPCSYTLAPTDSGRSGLYDVTITVHRIEEEYLGFMALYWRDGSSRDSKRYIIRLAEKGIALNSYNSSDPMLINYSGDLPFIGQALHLTCESSDSPSSSLRIVKKHSKEETLRTTVIGGALVYHFESIKCSDMGTYVCFYNKNTSQNTTVDVEVFGCPPQLCYGVNETRKIFAALHDTVNVDICVISRKLDSLRLESVFRKGNGTDKLPESRYNSSILAGTEPQGLYRNVNVVLSDVQVNDFGKITITLNDTFQRHSYSLSYEMFLVRKKIKLKIYKSAQQVPDDELFYGGESLHLRCEPSTSGFPLSSLRIARYHSREILHAPVFDGNLVYRFERLQCSDMGTYVCFHMNDTSENATVSVPVNFCPPQLCHVEDRDKTIYTSLNDNVTIDICVISWGVPSITSVVRNDDSMDELPKSRYKRSRISTMTFQRLYWKIHFVLDDIQDEDFGSISINLGSMIYEIVLARKDPPKLCQEENLTRTITAVLHTNIQFTICLVAYNELFVEKGFLGGKEKRIIERNRYRLTSENTGQNLYNVNIEMFNVQKEDFGKVTFRLKHRPVSDSWMDYEIFLQEDVGGELKKIKANATLNESESWHKMEKDDSLVIYVVSACVAVVTLILVGSFIYLKLRKHCSGASANHYQNKNTEQIPASSQQEDVYGYSATLYENAFAEQLHAMSQETDDEEYPETGPIYEIVD